MDVPLLMSFLDPRTKEQKINDELWRKEGVRSERSAIVEFLTDWLQGDIYDDKLIEEIVDIIERGGHHE
jgi:hypothetical protein